MQSTILASVNGRLGVGRWGEHSTALCHWAETSTQEAETIQVAWRCCFPSWDSHPSLIGPLPPSAEQGGTYSLLLPQGWKCSSSLLLFVEELPIHGSLEWQGNQILELKEYLKKSTSSQTLQAEWSFGNQIQILSHSCLQPSTHLE